MDGWVQGASWNGEVIGVLLDGPWPTRIAIGSHGYPQVRHKGRTTPLHRVLLGLEPGDGLFGDHVNGIPLDCRRANLRVVNASESSSNVAARTGSGVRGVYRARSGRWVAKGKRHRRQHFLGTYDTREEAVTVAEQWRIDNLPGYVRREEN
jgi:hypothetical protein